MSLSGAVLKERFQALDAFLLEHQSLWRPKPFTQLVLPWESQYPELAQWLRERSLEQAEAAHNQPHKLSAPAPFAHIAEQSSQLSDLPDLPKRDLKAAPARLSVDVPGRKWQQINAFAQSLSFRQPVTHWLDWCAGKGHLGRRLACADGLVTCLEFEPQLVEAGQQLSQRQAIAAEHVLQDVLADDAIAHLQPQRTPVALHACGELHTRLLQLACANRCQQLAVAPCCYNRISSEYYPALSQAAQASPLSLSRDDLSLPLSETVTAGLRQRRQRDQSMAQRLAFDLLQRQLRQCDDYLATPSLPVSWLQKPFAQYCLDLAKLKGLTLDPAVDWPSLEAAGWQRLAQVRNLELVRNLFRRPLELWLLLDRALYLQEQGYQVRLGQFCQRALSPRNVLLLAERQAVDNSVEKN